MKLNKTLTLLFATAALSAAVALPAWSALRHYAEGDDSSAISTLLAFADAAHPVMLADSGEHEDEGSVSRRESDEGEDACEEEDGSCGTAAAAPAPAGSVPPPQNGLFDNGAAPKAQVK